MSLLAIAFLTATSVSGAKERPISDHTQSVTIDPLQLFSPALHVEYERSISDKLGFAAGATVGKYYPLLFRLMPSGVEEGLGDDFSINTWGINSAINLHFKHFNRGWYFSGELAYQDFSAELAGNESPHWSEFRTVGVFGNKVAAKNGFTFAFDLGVEYIFRSEEHPLTDTPVPKIFPVSKFMLGWSF